MPVVLDFPPRELNPNKAASHWAPKARVAKRYREDSMWLTTKAKLTREIVSPGTPLMTLKLDFYPPMARGPIMDDDNMEAAFKPGRDGFADVMGINDRRFRVQKTIHERNPLYPRGAVIVDLLPLTE